MRCGSGGDCWLFVRNGGEAELEVRKGESGLRSKKRKVRIKHHTCAREIGYRRSALLYSLKIDMLAKDKGKSFPSGLQKAHTSTYLVSSDFERFPVYSRKDVA